MGTTFGMKHRTRIGFWNVRTLREKGRLRQVEREMESYRLDILGLSEVRWPEFGEVQTQRGGLFLYSGRPAEEDVGQGGVGLLLSQKARKSLMEWKPLNDRVMMARFHSNIRNVTIFQCYAPTEGSVQEAKEEFYSILSNAIRASHRRDIKLVMGDLNAKMGHENEGLEHIMGVHGLGERNENGGLFMDLCASHELVVGGTLFPHRICHKVTWVSPDQVTENQIDHIAISRKFRSSLLNVRNRRGADVGSDHHLVVSEIRLKILANASKVEPRKNRFDTCKLRDKNFRDRFVLELQNRFEVLENGEDLVDDVEGIWERVRQVYQTAGESVLGFRNRLKKDWMSEETWAEIDRRKELKLNIIRSKTRAQKTQAQRNYADSDRRIKRGARRDKRRWVDEQAVAAEEAARRGDSKELYNITRTLSQRRFRREGPVRDKNGTLLTSREEQLRRWEDHFKEILNKEDSQQQWMRGRVEEIPVNGDIDLECPTLEEIKDALKTLKNGKAPGKDNITAELLKVDLDTSARILYPLVQEIWINERSPTEWKRGVIVKLPKKGDTTNCNNWRGITLLSVPSKVVARIILNRIKMTVESRLRNEQAGFRAHRSCVDLINTLRIILEQGGEFQAVIYAAFIDFEKAFDSVSHRVLWHVLEDYGIPPKIVNIIRDLYDGYQCQVLHQGKLTQPISVGAGVRQGCILSPILFLLVLDAVMRRTIGGRRRGIQWGVNSRLEDLDYADDICLLSQRYTDMQFKLDALKEVADVTGLKINHRKTKVMKMNAENRQALNFDGEEIEEVYTFSYLGSVVSTSGGAEEDVKNRIKKANVAFVQLYPIWRNRNISRKTKLRIFNTNVKSVLLYACETWKVTSSVTSQLQVFVNRCLRRIMNIHWPHVIKNEDLWRETGQVQVKMQIRERKWRWLGHTLRKPDGTIEKRALEWNPQGARRRGRPRETWRRTILKEAKEANKTWGEVKALAGDRDGWRALLDALCSHRR